MALIKLLKLCGIVLFICVFTGCASLTQPLDKPRVKVAGLKLLPSQGFTQAIELRLLITNPNDRDLELRGISYTIAIESYDVLSGVSNQLPVLKAYQETPVNVVVSANVLQLMRLIEFFSQRPAKQEVAYNFSAKLDFSAWLPAMRVEEKGLVSLTAKH